MKKIKWFFLIVLLIGFGCVVFFSNPKNCAKQFVKMYGEDIESALHSGDGIPGHLGELTFNTWEGVHDMLEFVLTAKGNTYYGCYYSYDDVPLAFQNMEVELIQNGHDYWEWRGKGDNHGSTLKISDYWYYFEASF